MLGNIKQIYLFVGVQHLPSDSDQMSVVTESITTVPTTSQ